MGAQNSSGQHVLVDFGLCDNLRWSTKLLKSIMEEDINQITILSAKLKDHQPQENDVTLGPQQEPPILVAVQRACQNKLSVETLKIMIRLGYRSDVYADDTTGMTPLYTAAKNNRPDLVKILLAAGANANRWAKSRLSPLFIACASGNLDCVKILLDTGANPNSLVGFLQGTALHIATQSGHENDKAICNMLLDYGCVLSMKNTVGRSALNSLCGSKRDLRHIVNLLLDRGADIDMQDIYGLTPLMRAVTVNNREVASLLIDRGADQDIQDSQGRTIADLQQKHSSESIRTSVRTAPLSLTT